MMAHPQVSIITPTFNSAMYLKRLFSNLSGQNFSSFEWIIVDDGSKDNTIEIAKRFSKEARFPILIMKNNKKGAASARNTGIKNAKGKYLKFIDSDDLISKNHLTVQYNALYKKKSTIIISPVIVATIDKIGRQKKLYNIPKPPELSFGLVELFKRQLTLPFFSHSSCLFPKELILKIKGYDENLITDEDGDFILRLILEGYNFKWIDETYFYYIQRRREPRLAADDSAEKIRSRIKALEKIKEIVKEKNLSYIFSEAIAQKYDLLAQKYVTQYPDLALELLQRAKRIHPNYKIPNKNVYIIIRKLFGLKKTSSFKNFLNLKLYETNPTKFTYRQD